MIPTTLIIFLLTAVGLLATDPTPPVSAPILEPAVHPAPEDNPTVTQQMKEEFLNRYRMAIVTNDPAKYLALVCQDGLDDPSKAVVTQGVQRSLSFLANRIESISFDWTEPDPDDTKVFEKNGYRFHPNLKPVISLMVNIKREAGESKDLPTALQPTLGIKDGQLLILGMIHEKLPEPPKVNPPAKSDDDK
jgi:hypothetical protein